MRASTSASLAVAALIAATSVAGCAKLGELQAMRAFKAANQSYAAHDYKAAAGEYEEAISKNPNLGYAYFYLANSYDNQYKPSRRGDAENDALLQKAVENYTIAADKLAASGKPEDKNLANLSLKYLVAAYGVDKLSDPAKAEPVLIKMIQLDPADPTVYLQLAGYYNRQGQFDKTIAALEQRAEKEPTNPEAYQMIAGYYYEETNGDTRLLEAQKRDYVQKGIQAVDKAMSLKTDYAQAMTFKGLLLRQQALLEKDQAKIKDLLKEAEEWSEKANGLVKKQAAGAQ